MNKQNKEYFIDKWSFTYQNKNLGSVYYVRDSSGKAINYFDTEEEAQQWIKQYTNKKLYVKTHRKTHM